MTHEPHFCLLREVVSFSGGSRGRPSREVLENPCQESFILFQIGLLREYLELEFKSDALPFAFDLERVIDDFVLFCMLIGNDFLPGIPNFTSLSPCFCIPWGQTKGQQLQSYSCKSKRSTRRSTCIQQTQLPFTCSKCKLLYHQKVASSIRKYALLLVTCGCTQLLNALYVFSFVYSSQYHDSYPGLPISRTLLLWNSCNLFSCIGMSSFWAAITQSHGAPAVTYMLQKQTLTNACSA